MKDKKAEQSAAKQKHLKQLKAQRRKEPSLERPIAALTEKPSILIVCEGENTEPSYFNQFRINSAKVKSVGEGYNTVSLVNRLLKPFNVIYDGNGSKLIEEDFFELLEGIDSKSSRKRVELAILRAERNYDDFDHKNPAKEESTTTVFKLVRELLKYMQ